MEHRKEGLIIGVLAAILLFNLSLLAFGAEGNEIPVLSSGMYYANQWALKHGSVSGNLEATFDIGMEPAWQFYEQIPERRQVTVALIDTGVETGHADLQSAIWINEDEVPGDGMDNDNNGYVDDIYGWNFYAGNNQVFTGMEDLHGTHGAGTIAGAWDGQGITGIADSAYVKIMVLKVLGEEDGHGLSTGVKAAIRYARDNGADICNLSMGTDSYDPELEQLIRESQMLFVASAGNGDEQEHGYDIDQRPVYPASYHLDNLITVSNLTPSGALNESSNYGAAAVNIAAPGTYILSTAPGGYVYMTGTSMAAPMVAGAAALIYSCRTDLNLVSVRQAILDTAVKTENLAGKNAVGGVLNVDGAIRYAYPQ